MLVHPVTSVCLSVGASSEQPFFFRCNAFLTSVFGSVDAFN